MRDLRLFRGKKGVVSMKICLRLIPQVSLEYEWQRRAVLHLGKRTGLLCLYINNLLAVCQLLETGDVNFQDISVNWCPSAKGKCLEKVQL